MTDAPRDEHEPTRPRVGGWTKLYSSMVHSSIWECPLHVRVVWVTMLALCDENGYVSVAANGLARAANVTREQCFDALSVLTGPDEHSKDPDNEGRRIERVPQGFRILNYRKYRGYSTSTERSQKHRATNATGGTVPSDLISSGLSDLDQDQGDQKAQGAARLADDAREAPGGSAGAGTVPQVYASAPAPSADEPRGHTAANDSAGVRTSTQDHPGLRKTVAEPVPSAGVYEPPGGPRSHFVPGLWQPKPRHFEMAHLDKLDLNAEVVMFKLHEFERAFSDWDRAFDRWLTKARVIRETNAFSKGTRKPGAVDPMVREDNERHDDYQARLQLGMTRAEYEKRFGK